MDEESIFEAARKLKGQAVRAAYLDRACGQNDELRREIEALLKIDDNPNSFLERAAPGLDHAVDVNRDVMAAGLAPAFEGDAAVVVGDTGNSVLKSLSQKIPEVPHVTLHDSHPDPGGIVQPGSPELPDKQDDDRYQLFGEIARGGMGAIIKGRDTDLGRDLAIKVLLRSHQETTDRDSYGFLRRSVRHWHTLTAAV